MTENTCDVLIIGGGPAGATAGYVLAKSGVKTIIAEKATFPRFHIGESILPRAFPLIQELGLEAAFRKLPHVPKLGAEFGMGNDPNTTRFTFQSGFRLDSWTFNIERAVFDKWLLDEARAAGADVRENAAVRQIDRLSDGDCQATLQNGQSILSKYILDASGHGCVVGRHLGIRKPIPDPAAHKVAYFNHFKNVQRLPPPAEGHPGIILSDEGWFWLIAINSEVTSVGFVCSPQFHKQIGIPPNQLLAWAIQRCPVVRERMKNAVGPTDNHILADFSYTCNPAAGPGYFLIGDAACFLDPVFSTGVTLAMMSGNTAAQKVRDILAGQLQPAKARKQYLRMLKGSTGVFWHLIRNYYTHSFRQLFLEGQGPMNIHNAVISLLAGNVFPKPPWPLRWRLWVFDFCRIANLFHPMVTQRPRFSLLHQPGDLVLLSSQS